ncbi:cytochrome c oxidase accessory protein CcoG [Pseudoalteromonas sp. T1lg65]|uniref:cytochrome c oxidase accessory protein CcoG n=1 Tax=Pseudoalteromonas sp. T1lg65 TaxID=2077101 RepID=UPI003F7AF3E6
MKFDIKQEQLIIKPYNHDEPIVIREQKGRFQRVRRVLGWLLMMLFIAIPWLQYNQQQAVLLDIGKQQFRIFGVLFLPQDFMILAWVFMTGAFTLFFITAWLGRVWCGYTCPQTIWMLMFTWVEHRIEGTRNQRLKLAKSQWNANKLVRKVSKHVIWLLISLFTATSFLAYFVPAKTLYTQMFELQWSGLLSFWVFLFTVCTYGNAGFLREKMCTVACPYSRFQSVMFDKNTLLVSYDSERGESRGKRKRRDDPKQQGLGDCVDCNLCVEVCPAGIDIRNGLQYECINCGLCIDACNDTMGKFGYAKDLIKYQSERQQQGKKQKPLTLKLLGYGLLSLALVVIMIVWVFNRTPLELSVLRDRNTLYRVDYLGNVENTYTLNIINKTQSSMTYMVSFNGLQGAKLDAPTEVTVAAGEMLQLPVTIVANSKDVSERATEIEFAVESSQHPEVFITKRSMFYRNR